MNIHKEDDEYVKKLFPISDSEKNLKNNNTIYSKLLPEPYIGNLSNAELFTVMLNPGFSENDFKAIHTKNFKNDLLKTLYQEDMNQMEYPFIMINPIFSQLSGPEWWNTKLNHLCKTIEEKKGLKDEDARSFLSKNICNIELFPYHSKRFNKTYDEIKDFPCVKKMVEFVKYNLLPRAERGEIIVLFIRRSNVWENDILNMKKDDIKNIKNIKFIPKNYSQCAPVYPKKIGNGSPFVEINPMIRSFLLQK